MMIRNPALEQLGHVLSYHELLFRTELERVRRGQLAGQLARKSFRRLSAWRKDENWTEILGQSLGNQSRPVATDLSRQMIAQAVGMHFFLWHRTLIVPY